MRNSRHLCWSLYSHLLRLHPPDETNAAQIKGGRAGNCTRRKIGPPESNYHHLAHLPWPQINWPEAQAWAPAAAGGSYSLSVPPSHSRSRWLSVSMRRMVMSQVGRSGQQMEAVSEWQDGRTGCDAMMVANSNLHCESAPPTHSLGMQ